MIILKIILVPFSILYGLIVQLRNKFYDWGIFKIVKIQKPLISVGNLTTGGTGKTPLTIFISEYFLNNGKTVGIISRGYKRNSNETIIACDGNIIISPHDSGDELNMIATSLIEKHRSKFFVAAGADRVEAAGLLIERFNPDVIILDDAFQHRKIHRDLNIVIMDSHDYTKNRFNYTFTIPAGRLREFFHNIRRADLIINNHKSFTGDLKDYDKLPNLKMRYKTEYIIDYKNGIFDKTKKIIAFAGIAEFDSFLDTIKCSGLNPEESITYPDHHEYSAGDLDNLKQKFSEGKVYLTTEKDFSKLRQFKDFVERYPVYFIKIKTEIEDKENFLNQHLDKLTK